MKKLIPKSKRGSIYIEFLVTFFLLMLLLALSLAVLPVFIKYQNVATFASAVIRTAELSGTTDIDARINELKQDMKLNPTISFSGTEYITGTHKVNLSDKIVITLKDSCDIGFYTFGSFEIPIKITKSGRSEVYYK